MEITVLLVFILVGLTIGWLRPKRWLNILLVATSIFSIYWLQPLTPIRHLNFILPTVSILLTVWVWAITYPANRAKDQLAAEQISKQMNNKADQLLALISGNHALIILTGSLIVVIFMILKSEPLSRLVSSGLRNLNGQSPELAAPSDLTWLGYSFLAFRLLHAIRDRQANRLPAFSLDEFTAYALFFPAMIAGPIDRSQHFILEIQQAAQRSREPDWIQKAAQNSFGGLQRILIGAFKKFVLADSLVLIALNPLNAEQTHSTGWMWVFLLAFSLRIYLDFSGYTDIALGVARLMGVQLPENFDRPYLRQNLTSFWNSWHITLAQWFRSYVFNPFTRTLRSNKVGLPAWLVILFGQLLTMALIGVWHGLTWNFLIWGIWHAGGLFIQNRWSSWIQPRLDECKIPGLIQVGLRVSSWILTFLFVSLGWVWFSLPTPQMAIGVFVKLAGGGAG